MKAGRQHQCVKVTAICKHLQQLQGEGVPVLLLRQQLRVVGWHLLQPRVGGPPAGQGWHMRGRREAQVAQARASLRNAAEEAWLELERAAHMQHTQLRAHTVQQCEKRRSSDVAVLQHLWEWLQVALIRTLSCMH